MNMVSVADVKPNFLENSLPKSDGRMPRPAEYSCTPILAFDDKIK